MVIIHRMWVRIAIIILCMCTNVPIRAASPQDQFPKYETKYYIIQTDLDPDDAHEAAIRVTKMAEVYYCLLYTSPSPRDS